jgi:hypothetical protein
MEMSQRKWIVQTKKLYDFQRKIPIDKKSTLKASKSIIYILTNILFMCVR